MVSSPAHPTSARRESVTVILATYNRTEYLGEALESIFAQTRQPEQIILIDDGSDEDTHRVIARYARQLTYIWQPNAGRAAAFNRALQQATGEWLWFFDDDDVALPDSIERRLAAAQAEPDADIVLSEHYWGVDGPDGRIERKRHVSPRAPSDRHRLLIATLHNHLYMFQGTLVRRRCFEEIGGFDTAFLRSADYQMTVRLLRRYRAIVLREPTFIWRDHGGVRGPKALRHDESARKKVWMDFDGRLGRQIRAELALGEYLAPPVLGRALTPCESRLALLTRMSVMASKGLIDEALEDLAAAAAVVTNGGPSALSTAERQLCARAMTQPYWLSRVLEDPSAFVKKLQSHNRPRAPVMRLFAGCLARGLLHAARKSEHVARGRSILWRVWWRVAALAGPRPVVRAYLER